MTFRKFFLFFAAVTLACSTGIAHAEDYTLTIKNHKFSPETLEIPANQKVKITVLNQDPTPEEFESDALNREKVIEGGGTGVLFIGPLAAGTYPFVGEFNEATAQGQIIVK